MGIDTELNNADVHFGGFSLDNGLDVVIASPEPLYLNYDSDIIPATRNFALVLLFLHHGYPSRSMFHLNEYLHS
ncbi:hypothetical protein J6590_061416 [Homalodisca vitripennis]|nr:hypothetical protein J6590_061416 [Homalodisca vitripennis]